MDKKNFIHAIDDFQLDENLKYTIKRKVDNAMKNNQKQEKKSYKGRRVAIFSACLVAVLGVSMSMPIMADNTSVFENLISKIQERNEINPTKDYAVKVTETSTDDTQVTENVVDENQEYMSVYIDNYYCDGNTLYITYGIQSNDDMLSKCNCMFGPMDIKINGQSLDNGEKSTQQFTASSDELGVFIGKINVDVSSIENIQDATVDIDFAVNCAFDSINNNFNYDNLYYDSFRLDTTDENGIKNEYAEKYLDNKVSVNFDISNTDPQLDVYEVNKTQGGNTLNSVTVSPTGTTIDLDCQDDYNIILHDSTGKELIWNGEHTELLTFETPMIDATSIIVGFYDSTQAEPVYSFEVPIERGFNTGLDVPNDQCYVDVEPVFNPPIEEVLPIIKESVLEEFKDVPKIGETSDTFTCHYEDKENSEFSYGFILSANSYTIADNFDGLEVGSSFGNSSEYLDENGNLKDGYKAVIVDTTITSTLDIEQEIYRQFSLNDYTGLYFATNEPVAFDSYENYNKSAYAITLQPNETRNVKVGFVVDERIINAEMPLIFDFGGYGNDYYSVRLQ